MALSGNQYSRLGLYGASRSAYAAFTAKEEKKTEGGINAFMLREMALMMDYRLDIHDKDRF